MLKTSNIHPQWPMVMFLLLFFALGLNAQDKRNERQKFKFKSFGLSMGVYDPGLEYWKSDTNSQFKNADFSTNIFVNGFVEYTIFNDLVGKIAIGYWQTRAETKIPKYGKTTMLLTGTPVMLDLIYYASPARVAFITPYIGMGGELLFIQYGLDFEDKDNPDPVNGTTGLFSGLLGIQMQLSKQFSIDLFAEYKSGEYQQSFIREVSNPDPEVPSYEAEFTEFISLSGPKIGISLKYLFK
ncbi:MAG: hypothetical protein K9H16_13620 [Bacteroidales bacterium]|nr:hypothetical protein [Bacteroidales bacterium]